VNSADGANNAASVNRSTQAAAGTMTRKAENRANAAERETTRTLNQTQAEGSANVSASGSVQ
jgi:hypothetical protein